MGTKMNFEFDFEEVFEGIKKGVISELSEDIFDKVRQDAVTKLIQEIKQRNDLSYSELSDFKKEVKDAVIKEVINKLKDDITSYYSTIIESKISPAQIETIQNAAKHTVIEELKTEIFQTLKDEITTASKELIKKSSRLDILQVAAGAADISKSEIEYLKKRDQKLSALEAGGVDNWSFYSDSLRDAEYED